MFFAFARLSELQNPPNPHYAASICPLLDGVSLAVAYNAGNIIVWDCETGEQLRVRGQPGHELRLIAGFGAARRSVMRC
jgi:hypothetical protein